MHNMMSYKICVVAVVYAPDDNATKQIKEEFTETVSNVLYNIESRNIYITLLAKKVNQY